MLENTLKNVVVLFYSLVTTCHVKESPFFSKCPLRIGRDAEMMMVTHPD